MKKYCIMNFKTYNTAASIKAVQNEATRAKDYENVDKSRSHLNEVLEGDMNYLKAYKEAMKSDYYTKADKWGRMHKEPEVKAIGFVLTFSPEASGTFDEARWIEENMKFLHEVFAGAKINAITHRDETTLHIQGMIIPTTPQGKISKSYFIRDKKKLLELQDLYAEKMKVFGLERGEKGKLDRETEQAQTVRRLRAKIKALEKEVERDSDVIEKLFKRLQRAENELQKAKEIADEYKEALWDKRTNQGAFKASEEREAER